MHETRFINEIFTVLKQKLGEDAASNQVIINVRLSPFSHVSSESLRRSFDELIKGENFKNARLKISPLEILLECKNCKSIVRIAKRVFKCPVCNSADVNIQMDKEFFVESIEIERKEERVRMDFKQIDEARKILGLDEYASLEEIKTAYKELALKYHPDRCGDEKKKECEEKFKKIAHAKDILAIYCSGYKYSFKEKDVKRNTMDKEFYEHLKRFYDN